MDCTAAKSNYKCLTLTQSILTFILALAALPGVLKAYNSINPDIVIITLISTVILATIAHIALLMKLQGVSFSRDILHYIPTYASVFRLIVAILLPLALYTNYSHYIVYLYTAYYLILVTAFRNNLYHHDQVRLFRICLDIGFAIFIYITIHGNQNIAWLPFLIPLTTLARYYKAKWVYSLITGLIILLVVFNLQSILRLPDIFSNDARPLLLESENWIYLKYLAQTIFVLLLAMGIFLGESTHRKRIMMTLVKIRSNCGDIAKRICKATCSEAVVLIDCNRKMFYYCTNSFDDIADIEVIHDTLSEPKLHDAVSKFLKDSTTSPISCVQYKSWKNEECMKAITNLIGSIDPEWTKSRDKDIAAVHARFEHIEIIAVNNRPTSYKIVRRSFWPDDMQLIAISAKFAAIGSQKVDE